jgi:8-oxo-dGTP pyrophosphatase MutT (NUDIX family)
MPEYRGVENTLLAQATEKFIFGGKKLQITPRERAEFNLLTVGPFNDNAIKVTYAPRTELSPELTLAKGYVDTYVGEMIEDMNAQRTAQKKSPLVDMTKLRLEKIVEGKNECNIVLDPNGTSYGRHIALSREEDLRTVYENYLIEVKTGSHVSWEDFKKNFQPKPLTVLVGVVTGDGKLLIDKRSPKRVGTYPHAYHGIGGYIEPSDAEVDESGNSVISTTNAVQREAQEEAGLPPSSLKAITLLGAMMHREKGLPIYPELVFLARTTLRSHDIINESIAAGNAQRMLLNPKVPDGYMKARALFRPDNSPTNLLRALIDIDQLAATIRALPPKEGEDPKSYVTGHEVAATLPSTRAMAFLMFKLFEQSIPDAYRLRPLR